MAVSCNAEEKLTYARTAIYVHTRALSLRYPAHIHTHIHTLVDVCPRPKGINSLRNIFHICRVSSNKIMQ